MRERVRDREEEPHEAGDCGCGVRLAEEDAHHETEGGEGQGVREEEDPECGGIGVGQHGNVGIWEPPHIQQDDHESDRDDLEDGHLYEPRGPVYPTGQSHDLHRLFQLTLLLQGDHLEGDCRVSNLVNCAGA